MIDQPRTLGVGFILVFQYDEPTIVEHKLIGYKGETVIINKAKLEIMRKQMNEEFDKIWSGQIDGKVTLVTK